MPVRSFHPGELIFAEGDPPIAAYLILSGEIEIQFDSAAGAYGLARLGPGELFGDMALVSEQPRSATARAVAATTVEVLDESGFEQRILQDPARLREYLRTCVERVRAADTQLRRLWLATGQPAGFANLLERPFTPPGRPNSAAAPALGSCKSGSSGGSGPRPPALSDRPTDLIGPAGELRPGAAGLDSAPDLAHPLRNRCQQGGSLRARLRLKPGNVRQRPAHRHRPPP